MALPRIQLPIQIYCLILNCTCTTLRVVNKSVFFQGRWRGDSGFIKIGRLNKISCEMAMQLNSPFAIKQCYGSNFSC